MRPWSMVLLAALLACGIKGPPRPASAGPPDRKVFPLPAHGPLEGTADAGMLPDGGVTQP